VSRVSLPLRDVGIARHSLIKPAQLFIQRIQFELEQCAMASAGARFHLLQHPIPGETEAIHCPQTGSFALRKGCAMLGRLPASLGLLIFNVLAFPPAGHFEIIVRCNGTRSPCGLTAG
jgi:hypothetical protein